jgi:uncharacterized protein YbjT (DUF2867 family)
MQLRNVCILGGTGFVGRHIANRLAAPQERFHIRVLSRRRERNRHVLVIPNLYLYEADIYDEDTLYRFFSGCDAVINLVGILNESGKNGFQRAHVDLPELVVRTCKRAGVRQLLHMSALGANPEAPSRYQQTKAEGERLVHAAADDSLSVTSFRPSVIFGPEDDFFNRFARLLHIPGPFPLPTPKARFSPVYVGDVADAFVAALGHPESAGGARYELCGPRTYSLEELVAYTARTAGIQKRIMPLGDGLSRLQARLLGLVPGKPYSYDNYLSSSVDNVCSHNALPDLGIEPTAIEAVVPAYIGHGSLRSQYGRMRQLAHRNLETVGPVLEGERGR